MKYEDKNRIKMKNERKVVEDFYIAKVNRREHKKT